MLNLKTLDLVGFNILVDLSDVPADILTSAVRRLERAVVMQRTAQQSRILDLKQLMLEGNDNLRKNSRRVCIVGSWGFEGWQRVR